MCNGRIAGKKFKLSIKCHYEEEDAILNKNFNESLLDLKWSNNKWEILNTHQFVPEPVGFLMSINRYC